MKGDEMSHTPGPWTYQRATNYEGFSIAPRGTLPTLAAVERCGGERLSVECFNFPGETEDNARLMAVSPTLLAACQMQALLERVNHLDGCDATDELIALISKQGWNGTELAVLFIRRFRDAAIAAATKP